MKHLSILALLLLISCGEAFAAVICEKQDDLTCCYRPMMEGISCFPTPKSKN